MSNQKMVPLNNMDQIPPDLLHDGMTIWAGEDFGCSGVVVAKDGCVIIDGLYVNVDFSGGQGRTGGDWMTLVPMAALRFRREPAVPAVEIADRGCRLPKAGKVPFSEFRGTHPDLFPEDVQAADRVAAKLREACGNFRTSLGSGAGEPSEEYLLDQMIANACRVRAYLEAARSLIGGKLLSMLWMIQIGGRIGHLLVNYIDRREFLMSLSVEHEGRAVLYTTDDVNEFVMLWGVGVTKMDGKPILDGYYGIGRTPK